MNRRDLLRYISVLPLATTSLASEAGKFESESVEKFIKSSQNAPKRIAAIVTEYRLGSHADVIVGKYLEGFNQDDQPPYPRSKIISLFTEQVPANDISRKIAAKYNVPIFRTVVDALTLGGDKLAVDGVLLIGEHGTYPSNEKGQKLYPRFEMFLKITDVFRQYNKSVPVFNDKHLSWSWRQAKRIVEISRELKFPMLAGSSVPVAWRIPAIDSPYGLKQSYAVALSYSGLDVYGFHLLEAMQAITERRKGGETGIRSVQCLENNDCWNFLDENLQAKKLFDVALSRSATKKPGELKQLVKNPAVFIVNYNDGLQAAAFLMTGLVEDFTVAVDIEGQAEPFSTLMKLQSGRPHHHFGCLVKNIEIMFQTGKSPYPVERTMLTSGMLDFILESKLQGSKEVKTPELAAVNYKSPPGSHYFAKGWDKDGKRLD
ncbi:hypothetical protein [Daejeonella lutea]|uniref:Uncharacterized protein n=1 Tax=Daejeonella lutea TaxID=572036 RepID=A0A1T5C191_9SPHI|nr:hypothetical protein [Daejeonella lutea]SKB53023.1 hypothetical protein SAMN05661099_1746 [Daejeonella lutea]